MVQWLGLCFHCRHSFDHQGAKIPNAVWHGHTKKLSVGQLDRAWQVVSINNNDIQPQANQCPTIEVIGGNSLVAQWLGLYAFTAKGPGSIPGWGTKIPQASHSEKTSQKSGHLWGVREPSTSGKCLYLDSEGGHIG